MKHVHDAKCQHGIPNAVPAKGSCPVCGAGDRKSWCEPHHQWECSKHPHIGFTHTTDEERRARQVVTS